MPNDTASSEVRLRKSIDKLTKSVSEMEHLRTPKTFFWTFLRGIVYGLGLITAAAIVIPVIVLLLRSVEWLPLLGGFISDIINNIEQTR